MKTQTTLYDFFSKIGIKTTRNEVLPPSVKSDVIFSIKCVHISKSTSFFIDAVVIQNDLGLVFKQTMTIRVFFLL